ncbi:hypothetical protein C8R43DRAFT_941201 [Mycena crocata]|nr:hypothetical protein C8R43DRAFT_941201 [Mycena crocata]
MYVNPETHVCKPRKKRPAVSSTGNTKNPNLPQCGESDSLPTWRIPNSPNTENPNPKRGSIYTEYDNEYTVYVRSHFRTRSARPFKLQGGEVHISAAAEHSVYTSVTSPTMGQWASSSKNDTGAQQSPAHNGHLILSSSQNDSDTRKEHGRQRANGKERNTAVRVRALACVPCRGAEARPRASTSAGQNARVDTRTSRPSAHSIIDERRRPPLRGSELELEGGGVPTYDVRRRRGDDVHWCLEWREWEWDGDSSGENGNEMKVGRFRRTRLRNRVAGKDRSQRTLGGRCEAACDGREDANVRVPAGGALLPVYACDPVPERGWALLECAGDPAWTIGGVVNEWAGSDCEHEEGAEEEQQGTDQGELQRNTTSLSIRVSELPQSKYFGIGRGRRYGRYGSGRG